MIYRLCLAWENLEYFSPHFEKQDGHQSRFYIFFLRFFPHPLTLTVLKPQFSNFQEKLITIRSCLKILFWGVCMYVHWLGGLNLLLPLCSKYYSKMKWKFNTFAILSWQQWVRVGLLSWYPHLWVDSRILLNPGTRKV